MRPLKFIVVVSEFPLLSNTFILNEIASLLDRGHDVKIIAYRKGPVFPLHPVIVRHRLPERTTFLKEPRNKFELALYLLIKSLPAFARGPGPWIKTASLALAGKLSPGFSSLYRLSPFLKWKSENGLPDVVLCHFGSNGRNFIFIKRIFPEVLFITKFHGESYLHDELEGVSKKKPSGFYRELFAHADFILTCNIYFQPLLAEMGADTEKMKVHHCGVPIHEFQFRQREIPPGEPIRIMTVARLSREKSIQTAVEAVSLLKSRGVDVKYRIVGDGPERLKIEQMIRNLELDKEVILTGPQNSEGVIEEFSRTHLYVLPSTHEGIAVSLMEALASGVIAIASRTGGIPELIEDGVTGYLFNPRDPADLAGKIIQAVNEKDHWREITAAALKKVEKQFEIEAQTDSLMELIKESLRKTTSDQGKTIADPD